jgi:acetyltransferase-like isoleucine patch superfamily enzyme
MKFKFYRLLILILIYPFNGRIRARIIKKLNFLKGVGDNCVFYIKDFGTEPYLIKIHNNVEIASGVRLVTHDDSVSMLKRMNNNSNVFIDSVGSIEIFDNCFIGTGSIILPNVKIGPNAIIAAGSVVTKNVDAGQVVAGIPASKINTFDNWKEKTLIKSQDYPWKNIPSNLVTKARENYFWGQ